MDEKSFKKRAARLEEIGAVVAKLPPEVRAQAFDLLKSYIVGHEVPAKSTADNLPPIDGEPGRNDSVDSKETFFSAFEHDTPADNVRLVAAFLFSNFGAQPFKADEIQTIADEVGITVPSRIDMTIRMAAEDGKKLFTSAGRGLFKPTVHGEGYFKREYKVRKGTRQKPSQPLD